MINPIHVVNNNNNKKNTLGETVLQYHEHVQRIMIVGHISSLLLSQNSQENEFSLLFWPFFRISLTEVYSY